MTKVELPRWSKLQPDNDYNALWRVECSFQMWKRLIKLMDTAYPHGVELLGPPEPIQDALATWYFCREQMMAKQHGGKHWNNVGTSHVIILKSEEQMSYFLLMKETLKAEWE